MFSPLSLCQGSPAASGLQSSLDVHPNKPDQKLLLHIAECINTDFQCMKLAVFLGIEADFISKPQLVLKDPKAVAFEVLREWSRGDNATSLALYTALNVKDFKQIATEFKEDLLSAGMEKHTTYSEISAECVRT